MASSPALPTPEPSLRGHQARASKADGKQQHTERWQEPNDKPGSQWRELQGKCWRRQDSTSAVPTPTSFSFLNQKTRANDAYVQGHVRVNPPGSPGHSGDTPVPRFPPAAQGTRPHARTQSTQPLTQDLLLADEETEGWKRPV